MKQKLLNLFQRHINALFALLRLFFPTLSFNNLVIVSRYSDVEEILNRPNVFGVTYAEKMGIITDGSNFFLGMNDTPLYERDVSDMRILMPRADVASVIKPSLESYADQLVANLGNEFDMVSDLSARVPVYFCDHYMGVPGPDEQRMIDWATYMFWYLFFPDVTTEQSDQAIAYAAETRQYLDTLIQNRKQSEDTHNDVIARALDLQKTGTPGMTDIDIRNNLIGMIIGAIPTTSKCAVLVLDYLLDHPEQLALARQLVRDNQDDQLASLVLEVLRFNVFGAGIFRIALQDYKLSSRRFRCRKIKQGSRVLALTQSAMFDGRAVNHPRHFSLDRPRHIYMPFGAGMHTCFGYHINLVQIPAILKPVLRKRHVERLPGATSTGPFPAHFPIGTRD